MKIINDINGVLPILNKKELKIKESTDCNDCNILLENCDIYKTIVDLLLKE